MANCRTSLRGRISRSGVFATFVTLLAGVLSADQNPCPTLTTLNDEPKVTIGWTAGGWGNQNYAHAETVHVKGAPDGLSTYVSGSTWLVTATFNQKFTYKKLASALGLTAADLKTYDIIAFEGNSDVALKRVFENSIWFVTDNVVWASGTFMPAGPVPAQQLKFRTGTLCVQDYKQLFGIKEFKDKDGNDITGVGWIVVDIPDKTKMDTDSLKIFLTGVALQEHEGSPDPDAIGLIIH